MDWSIVVGLALGLGIPALGGLNIIVRMENRITQVHFISCDRMPEVGIRDHWLQPEARRSRSQS